MIPVSLTLKNLLSYGEGVPTLDFSPFHVACISGKNGHGKSALLDAITWSLWGEARKPPGERKPDDSLLRIGATDMRVDFEFELEGDRYRVIRSFRKTGKGSVSNLELQLFDPAAGYRTLSEDGSVRKTQARINGLLRMSYDTFTNAAFLLQGRADEFTRRSARERKTILAEILGLSRYDELAALARSHAQKVEVDASGLRRQLDEISEAVARKPELTQGLQRAAEALVGHEADLVNLQTRLDALRADHSRIEFHRKELDDLKANQEGLRKDQAGIEQQSTKLEEEIASHDSVIQKREQILAEAERYTELQATEAQLRGRLEDLRTLELEQANLEKEITQARHDIERRLTEWEAHVREGESAVAEADAIVGEKSSILADIEKLGAAREQVKTFEACREARSGLEGKVSDLRRKLETSLSEVRVGVEMLQAQRRPLEQATSCCETRTKNLAAAREQEAIARRIEDERGRIRDEGTRLTSQIQAMQDRRPVVERELSDVLGRHEALVGADGPECPLCGNELDGKHRDLVQRELDGKADTLRKEKADIVERLQILTQERDGHRLKFQELKNQLADMGDIAAAVARADTALKEAGDARARLGALDTELTAKQESLSELETEGPEAKQFAAAQTELDSVTYDAAAHQTAREAVERLTPVEARRLQLDSAEKKRAEALSVLPDQRRKRDTARLYLQEKQYAEPQQVALEQVQRRVASLGYDADAHRAFSQDIDRLKDAPAMKERLLSAERERVGAERRLKELQERFADIAERLRRLDSRISELNESLTAAARIEGDLTALQETLIQKRGERDLRLQEKASLQTQLDSCAELESGKENCRKQLTATERDIRIYKELVTAFGKDGIQSLLIEQAIPEIEQEANRILGRLTDNRTQITLESLRDLKKGGTRETLDIRISDELGERSYELYSGGEAFRVDFALRIALSRLLARRAGTRLRTLIIDEGFGTQDTEGLERLVEAIQSIRDDFEKILVITHIEALKNAFPVRIEVTKHPDIGSRYEIVA